MVIKYNVTGAERKRLVTTLSTLTGVKAKYLGMPSMASFLQFCCMWL